MIQWQRMGIRFAGQQNIVMGKSYETLTSSAIIDKLYIDPDSILLIDDVKGNCTKKCNVVELGTYEQTYKNKNGHMDVKNVSYLKVNPKDYDIKTDLWDGQSLLQSSCFKGKYADKGFLLLRNHFGKTAAFNTDIYGYLTEERKLKDDDKLSDRFGDKIKVKDVKMVTTKNSMKIFKFTDVVLKQFFKPEEYEGKDQIEKEHMVWLWYKRNMLNKWGICKYEKSSKYEEFQQLTYQVLNSLDLSEEDIYKLTEAYINHINLINRYPAFFKKHIGDKLNDDVKSTMMLKLLMINDKMSETQWYKNYRNSQVDNLKNRAKCGKILIPNTDYAVLVGNPVEMLKAACGDKIESSLHKGFECYSSKFDNDIELTGFRSPHILNSNSALLINTYHDEFKWFKLNDNILVVNFFGDGAILSNIWNGCDTDSDSVLIGTNSILLNAVKKLYDIEYDNNGKLVKIVNKDDRLVPVNDVPAKETILDFIPDNIAKIDSKLSNDSIGIICNMAQQLQSLYHHAKSNGIKDVLTDIYNDLCLLEVMSNIAIDSAKREYKCNLKNELSRIRKRYYLTKEGAIIKGKSATVTKMTYRKNISATDAMKYKELSSKSKDKLTDDDKELISKITKPIEKKSIVKPDFLKKVQRNNKSGKYIKLNTPMDVLGKLINKHVKRAKGSTPVWICDLLVNTIKYDDVSTTRINSIKKEAIKATKLINKIFAEQKKGKSLDKTFAEIDNISNTAIEYMQKFDKLTVVEICRLIRDVYDYKEKRDVNGKIIKDENGKKIIERDKRDKNLINCKAGGYMLQWLYEAHTDLFLSAIKVNTGNSTYVFEDDKGDYEDLGKRYSIVEWEDPETLTA
jgi:hypothetical protein